MEFLLQCIGLGLDVIRIVAVRDRNGDDAPAVALVEFLQNPADEGGLAGSGSAGEDDFDNSFLVLFSS